MSTENIECKKCKNVNPTDSNYCKNCGEDLTLQIKEETPDKNVDIPEAEQLLTETSN